MPPHLPGAQFLDRSNTWVFPEYVSRCAARRFSQACCLEAKVLVAHCCPVRLHTIYYAPRARLERATITKLVVRVLKYLLVLVEPIHILFLVCVFVGLLFLATDSRGLVI